MKNLLKTDYGNTLDIPTPLSRNGRKAAAIIKKYMHKKGYSTGGSRTFYTPREWTDRGESYGCRSELVFVYDGGDLYSVMNHELGGAGEQDLSQELAKAGLYHEQCTGWYSAIYKI
jgi:hypothetical protein|tara:strand:- start:16 stop:363 length:348 start_codon:yes stop_codon:yes gene_type:complete